MHRLLMQCHQIHSDIEMMIEIENISFSLQILNI
jgi:hypothetical protein